MMEMVKKVLPRALVFILILTILCGVIYPLVVTGISQLFFPHQANGSIIEIDGKKYGTTLLAQQFSGDTYLWGRIMNLNTETFYDEQGNPLLYAGPSNLSPASEDYKALITERIETIKAAHPEKTDDPIPNDLVTSSGSGLDPHISLAAANYQVQRIAQNRKIPVKTVQDIIDRYTTGRFLGIFGEPTINVLQVNLALDGILS